MIEEGIRFIVTTSSSVYITPTVTMNDDREGITLLDMSNVNGPTKVIVNIDTIESIVREKYSQEDVTIQMLSKDNC